MKQTMKIHASVENASKSENHLVLQAPVRSTLEIAMEKAGYIVDRDKPKMVDPKLVEMYEQLERQMILLRAAIHHDKIQKGIIEVDQTSPYCTETPAPQAEPVVTKIHREPTPIHIFGQTRAKKPVEAKAETRPVEKAKARDDHKAGKEAFRDTFRDAVLSAFSQLKPGYMVEAHTVNADDPTSTKYRVYFNLSHHGSTVVLERKSKREHKAFTVEIPLRGGKLLAESIPAYANELKSEQ